MSYHQFQRFEESQIETVNLFIKQNTYFFSNLPSDFIFSCTNISVALLYFGMPNNLRMLLLYAILNFLIAATVPLYHIVEQYILDPNDLNKVHFTSGEHLANFLDKIFIFA